jgi:hypothetical protein
MDRVDGFLCRTEASIALHASMHPCMRAWGHSATNALNDGRSRTPQIAGTLLNTTCDFEHDTYDVTILNTRSIAYIFSYYDW